ncbi:ATP-dependent DNA helicase PIF1 [Rhizophagus irregularis DAOM 181602=DAOM 197198]|nr:ATP-dependent DNA helicase PIF1 [Rhizophagus irregularis DAOM 181602=DAOM 197198]
MSEEEISMLQDFCIKMENIRYNLCNVCQERIPLLMLVKGTCKRCYYEKNTGGTLKKFSGGNNMHPGDVPDELKGLSEIKEMLISQENNPYYEDIIIDTNILQSLPENDSIFNMLPQLQDDESGEDDGDNIEDGEDVSRTFVPLMLPTQREGEAINATLDQMQNDNPLSLWPEIEGVPINEFHTPGYMVRAFPTLYLYGRADLRSARVKEVKPAEYFRHLLWYKDGRFARYLRWRYFALNSSMRWRALQEGQIYVKQNLKEEQINVSDIQEMIANGDNKIADRIMRYGEGLRGTRQFWIARRKELLDLIKQIGADGLIFFTFSAADMHWPKLHKLMENNDHNGDEAESSKRRQQNIIDNLHIATWFFKQRFETFFKDVLKKNAPKIDWSAMKDNEDVMNNVIQYLDSIVTTINPDMHAPIPERHPCQKRAEEINDDLQDYVELINKLQRHTKCSPSYCLRSKHGQQVCKFGYPKERNDHSFIREDNHEQPELVTSRNDPYLNSHNRLQLQGWRANVDIKPVLTIHAALQYISKYASKSEPKSVAFTEIFNQILNKSNSDDNSLASIQKLLLNSIAERDISAQETCHLLLGIPLYHSSRQNVLLNLNEEAPRCVQGTGSRENDEDTIMERGRTTRSPLRKYWDQDDQLEDFSLYRLYLTHKYTNGKWVKCKKENIVRILPRPSGLRNGDQWAEFCRVKVILHVPHRSIKQLNGNRQAFDEEAEISEEESYDEIEEEEHEEYRYDWMHLAEMGPNVHIQRDADLGSRDMDRKHNWTNDAQQQYSEEDIANASEFVRQSASNNNNIISGRDNVIEYQNLNEKQKKFLRELKNTTTIPFWGNMLSRKDASSPVLVIAPTGVASFNINRATIHSTLSIPIKNNKDELSGIRLKKLQERVQDVRYFIIDEKSMVGRRMLGFIDMRLREAFSENKNEPFSGRSVILFGDFGQLAPVLDVPMFATNARSSSNVIAVYRQFKEVYELDIILRQSGNDQQGFRDILLRLRDGESTLNDWNILTSRFEENLNRAERDRFQDAVFIHTTWPEVYKVNIEMLRRLNRPIAKICAVHSGGRTAKRAKSDVAKGLEAEILLAKGCRVMLTSNIWTEAGLVNRSMGVVEDILFKDQGPPALPTAVFIKFERYDGPTITSLEGKEVVPIVPIKRSWDDKNGLTYSRTQLPICLAWSITAHKSQGLTLDKVNIDIGVKEFAAGLTFVVLSRVQTLNDLCLKQFSFDRLQRIKEGIRL